MNKPKAICVRDYRYVSPADVQPDDEQSKIVTARCVDWVKNMEAIIAMDDIALARACSGIDEGLWGMTNARASARAQLDKYGPSAERTVAVSHKLKIR